MAPGSSALFFEIDSKISSEGAAPDSSPVFEIDRNISSEGAAPDSRPARFCLTVTYGPAIGCPIADSVRPTKKRRCKASSKPHRNRPTRTTLESVRDKTCLSSSTPSARRASPRTPMPRRACTASLALRTRSPRWMMR